MASSTRFCSEIGAGARHSPVGVERKLLARTAYDG